MTEGGRRANLIKNSNPALMPNDYFLKTSFQSKIKNVKQQQQQKRVLVNRVKWN